MKLRIALAAVVAVPLFALGCSTDPGPQTPLVTVTSVSPTEGSTAGGTVITVTGTGFAAGATVTFGGVAATSVTVSGTTSASVTTPAHAAGAVDVVVTLDGKSVTLSGAYTYKAPPAPTLASIAPATGTTAGGTPVTLTGTGFSGAATVTFGGTAATAVVVAGATTVTATTPAHAAGAVNVVLTIGGTTVTLASAYTYAAPAPTLATVAPATGLPAGGTPVTLTGTGFRSGATVTFAGTAATAVTVASDTSITCTTPAHAAGAVDVVVTNSDSKSATKAGGFTYALPAPTITSVTPASGPAAGGTSVTLLGTGYQSGGLVRFGGVAASCAAPVGGTSITCVTAAHAAGQVDVVLQNPDNQSVTKTAGFEYLPAPVAPTLASVVPGSGPIAGGTTVILTGTGFNPQSVVYFGQGSATSTFIDSTHLSVKSPASAGPRVASVSVSNQGFPAAGEVEAFTWMPDASEVIVATSGTSAGGAALLVFAPGASGNVPPNGESLFGKTGGSAGGDKTQLVAPSRLFVQPGGSLFVVNSYPQNDGALLEFAWQVNAASPGGHWAYGHFTGNVSPVAVVANPVGATPWFAQPTGLAWDDTAGQIIVGSFLTGDLAWFDPGTLGTTGPARTLKTRGGGLGGVVADDRYQELFVVNGNSGTIDVYEESASSTANPKRTLTIKDYNGDVAHGGDYAVDLFLNGDELFVLLQRSLLVYGRTDSGTLAPARKLAGSNIGFTSASGLGYDLAKNELYVVDRGAGTQGLYVFDRAATGNVAPLRTLKGAGTDLADPIGVYVNHDKHDCHAGPPVTGSPNVSLWFDAACGKTLGVTSAGVVSWTDRKAGVTLTAAGGVAKYAYYSSLTVMSIQTDQLVGFSAANVPGTLLGPSDQFTFYSLYRNNLVGSNFTNGVLLGWDTDAATGDPAHIRVHAPYQDNNFYFDTGTLAGGRLSAVAPAGWGGNPRVLVGQRTDGSATLWEDAITAGRSLGSATALSGGIDTSLKGTLRVANQVPGMIGEVLVITGALTAPDATVISNYLSSKWYYNY